MDPKTIAIVVIVLIALAVIAWAVGRRRRTAGLRRRFGPEYERTLREQGPRGESVLLQREKRVEKFPIRELEVAEREKFITEWRVVQSHFVDDPRRSVSEADRLVTRVMERRGYPMSDFDQRAADISVDHPRVVDNYRAAHEIALRERQGAATTEDLRGALIYYRSLFDDLLRSRPPETTTTRKEVA